MLLLSVKLDEDIIFRNADGSVLMKLRVLNARKPSKIVLGMTASRSVKVETQRDIARKKNEGHLRPSVVGPNSQS
jgi:hypothetical protein